MKGLLLKLTMLTMIAMLSVSCAKKEEDDIATAAATSPLPAPSASCGGESCI